jgi:competence protein ComEA
MFRKILIVVFVIAVSISAAFAGVNINTASQTELEGLTGVGPALAKAIIDYRTNKAPFKTIEDLQKVKGLSKATFDKIKSQITVTDVKKTQPAPAKKAAK